MLPTWLPLPTRCDCGSKILDWYDLENNAWSKPDLTPMVSNTADPVWISGDVDADLSGSESPISYADRRLRGNQMDSAIFNQNIAGGVIRNVQRVDGPPLSLEAQEPRPLQEPFVSSILVEHKALDEAVQKQFVKFVEVKLLDVRIHHWKFLASKHVAGEGHSGETGLISRVTGRIYGCMVIPDAIRDRRPTDAAAITETNNRLTHTNVGTDARAKFGDTSDVTQSDESLGPTEPACASCSFLLRLIFAGLVWWACGVPLAILDFSIMGLACVQDSFSKPYRTRGDISQRNRIMVPLLFLASLGGIIWFYWSGCSNASIWPLALPALALLASPWFAGCLSRMLLLLLLQWAVWSWCGLGLGACAGSGIPIDPVGVSASGQASSLVMPAPGVPSGSIVNVPLPASAAGVAVLTPGSRPSVPGSIPGPGPQAAPQTVAPSLPAAPEAPPPTNVASPPEVPQRPPAAPPPEPNMFERINQALGQKIAGDVTSVVTSTSGLSMGGRVGIDDALENPDLFESCEHTIYLPNALLFNLDRSELRSQARPDLEKLARLMSQYPGERFIITGHADRTGEGTPQGTVHNLRLSERRASTMASWLANEMGVGLDHFDVQGAGSRLPMTDVSELEGYNRRVEIRMRCKNEKSIPGGP